MEIFLKDGTLFAPFGCERVVHGGRGSYVEFNKNQILPHLVSKFTKKRWSEDQVKGDETFYYYWLTPEKYNLKVYYQLKEVGYADYVIGKYYVSLNAFKPFNTIEGKV